MDSIDSKDLFLNYRRMRFIRRCNLFPNIMPMDVAQHSYYVAMLSMLFADELTSFYHKTMRGTIHDFNLLNYEVLMKKALLHDTEEAFVSDIPYQVKHYSSDMENALNKVTQDAMKDLCLEHPVLRNWDNLREDCKQGAEGSIVAFCDMLELALYSYEEISMGNYTMKVTLSKCNKYLDDLFFNALSEAFEEPLHAKLKQYLDRGCAPTIFSLKELVSSDPAKHNDLENSVIVI